MKCESVGSYSPAWIATLSSVVEGFENCKIQNSLRTWQGSPPVNAIQYQNTHTDFHLALTTSLVRVFCSSLEKFHTCGTLR